MKKEIHCPYCDGTGKMRVFIDVKNNINLKMKEGMFKMRKRGYTLRQIAQKYGYKSPGNIAGFLKSYVKEVYGVKINSVRKLPL